MRTNFQNSFTVRLSSEFAIKSSHQTLNMSLHYRVKYLARFWLTVADDPVFPTLCKLPLRRMYCNIPILHIASAVVSICTVDRISQKVAGECSWNVWTGYASVLGTVIRILGASHIQPGINSFSYSHMWPHMWFFSASVSFTGLLRRYINAVLLLLLFKVWTRWVLFGFNMITYVSSQYGVNKLVSKWDVCILHSASVCSCNISRFWCFDFQTVVSFSASWSFVLYSSALRQYVCDCFCHRCCHVLVV